MTGIQPKTLSFTHDGEPILAVLVEDPPGAGSWTLIETCAMCNQPLGHHPFYTTDPLRFYLHSHCIYDYPAAAAAPPVDAGNFSNSGTQSRSIFQRFMNPSYPVPATFPPSYMSNPFYNSGSIYSPSPLYCYSHFHPPCNHSSYQSSPATYHPSYMSNPYYLSDPYYSQYHPYPAASQPHPPQPHASPSRPSSSSSSSSSSSVPGWAGLAATTVVGSFLQALFSSLISGS